MYIYQFRKEIAMRNKWIALLWIGIGLWACEDGSDCGESYQTTAYEIPRPEGFPIVEEPEDNPTTVEGVALGRKLFYEKRLSGDDTQACASCHLQENAFSDPDATSEGIDGLQGNRNAMAIVNLAWRKEFFWDGRANTLEEQAFLPVIDPIEMHETWPNAVAKLQSDEEYPTLFEQAFGTSIIDSVLAVKAIAQFERSMVSGNSRYDQFLRGEISLTVQENAGLQLFRAEGPVDGVPDGADCFHCHGEPLFTDNSFHNNGLDENSSADEGLYNVTGEDVDRAKFKTPTLRNIEYTAPYMHDGRFTSLEEVVAHYNSGGHASPTIDPLMKYVGEGMQLTATDQENLIAFLKALSDPEFINNPSFSDPN